MNNDLVKDMVAIAAKVVERYEAKQAEESAKKTEKYNRTIEEIKSLPRYPEARYDCDGRRIDQERFVWYVIFNGYVWITHQRAYWKAIDYTAFDDADHANKVADFLNSMVPVKAFETMIELQRSK